MYEDKTLVCKDCHNEFIFTAGEQEFYAEKGFVNEPQRCKACRDAKKQASKAPREMHDATCEAYFIIHIKKSPPNGGLFLVNI